ncbi:MFS monocarboxylate transporter-like protein [Podospora didyma]|uniref:MFS monocarboxylate transporter-like protein n=1 Tax=Podospora didyma TaxID=330526 RepID=A0AAE0U0C8_9PEZI|nr:MFS monocarboxylate transporter-like protein [Podospora didyma]
MINGFGMVASYGIFLPHWQKVLNRPASDVSWVGSLQLCMPFAVSSFSGRVMDAGYFRPILVVGCGLHIFGIFCTASLSQYWQLDITLALGVASCGAPVGGVIFPVLQDKLDYSWVIRIMGFVVLFNTILILLIARPKKLHRPRAPLVDLQAWKEPAYTLFAIGLFTICPGLFFPYFYMPKYGGEVIGLPSSTSLTMLLILNSVGIPARLIPTFVAHYFFGAFSVLIPFSFCTGIMNFVWLIITEPSSFISFSVVFGVVANAVLTTDLTKMGTRIGMIMTFASLACLIGPPISGFLIARGKGSFRYAQIFAGTTVLAGTAIMCVSRWLQIWGVMKWEFL